MDSRSDELQPDPPGEVPRSETSTAGEHPKEHAASAQQTELVPHRDTDTKAPAVEGAGAWNPPGVEWDVPPGWRVPWPEPPSPAEARARVDRMLGILTSAATSAAVSLLVLWLWGSAGPAYDQGNVTVTYQPLDSAAQVQHRPADGSQAVNQDVRQASMVPAARGSRDIDGPAAVSPTSALVVITQPEGARVTINGVGYGTTPARIRFLPPGAKRIRVTKDGFAAEERVIGAEARDWAITLRIALREAPVPRNRPKEARDRQSVEPRR